MTQTSGGTIISWMNTSTPRGTPWWSLFLACSMLTVSGRVSLVKIIVRTRPSGFFHSSL